MAWNNIKEIEDWIGDINEPDNYRTNLYFLIDAINKLDQYKDLKLKDINTQTNINASEFWQYFGVIYQQEHNELKNNFFSSTSKPTIVTITVDSKILQALKKPANLKFKEKPNLEEATSEDWVKAFEICANKKEICGTKSQQDTKCILIKDNNSCPIKCVGRLAYAIANKKDKDDDILHPYVFNTTTYRNKFPKELESEYTIECEEIKNKLEKKVQISNEMVNKKIKKQPLNQILYGSPGTGKTYNTINKALEIIFSQDKECGHEPENLDKEFDITQNKEDDKCQYETIKKSYRKAFDNDDRNALKQIFEEYKKSGQIEFVTFHQSYGYEEFVEGIKAETNGENITYEVKPGIFKRLCKESEKPENLSKNYILIIDEINRGNISKIFGELITLIEPSKRIGAEEEIKVKLPYSGDIEKSFGVPSNLYIIGTMNTADRSIAPIDTALRRRFVFEEMAPDSSLLTKEKTPNIYNDVNLKELLEAINTRIEYLYDRDHTIGHAYLIDVENLNDLIFAFKNKIIPLLAEYFYEDWENIDLVLNQNGFIVPNNENKSYLSEKITKRIQNKITYKVSDKNWEIENFQKIYDDKVDLTKKEKSEQNNQVNTEFENEG